MILDANARRLVLAGRKTMVRLPVQEPRTVVRKNGVSYETRPFRPAPGAPIAVQPAVGRPVSFRVIVVEVRFELLGAITYDDARAEGWRTTLEFKRSYLERHDDAWIAAHPDVDEHEISQRFHKRFDGRPVWATRFMYDPTYEEPRLLMPASRGPSASHPDSADAHGYTASASQALPGEPPAIHPELAEFYAQDARERDLDRPGRREQLIRKRLKTLQGKVHRLAADGVDLTAELDRLEASIELLERQRRAA